MLHRLLSLTTKSMMIALLLGLIAACSASAPPAPTEIPVEVAVQQTIDARDAVDLQVRQTVDAQLAVQATAVPEVPPELPAEGDVADPNANLVVVQPVVDPNLAGGTPQLRVTRSSVNVRSGPGTNYPPINSLRQDAVVVVVAKNQVGNWFLIELPGGIRGWISNTVTTPVVEADMIKVVIAATIPAPPVVRATAVPPTTAPTTAAVATTTPVATTASTRTSATATTNSPTHTPTATTAATTAATATATTPPTATFTPMPTATFTPEPIVISVVLTVQNNSGIEICFLFIDLSRDPWGNDRLGPTETILPGGQVSIGGFPSDEYDFMAQDCSGNVINSLFNVQVGGGFTWDVR